MTPQWLQKKIQTFKYENIIYHLKAHDLEIPLA